MKKRIEKEIDRVQYNIDEFESIKQTVNLSEKEIKQYNELIEIEKIFLNIFLDLQKRYE